MSSNGALIVNEPATSSVRVCTPTVPAETVGVSLEPCTVTATAWSRVAPWLSVTRTV